MYAERGSSPFLFPSTRAPKGHVMEFRRAWQTICHDAGLKDFRIHDCRHSFASFIISKGVSLKIIGDLLGHSQTRTTERYAHLMLDAGLAASEQLPDFSTMALAPKPVAPMAHACDTAAHVTVDVTASGA
jgi:site-specific recombinase XerD